MTTEQMLYGALTLIGVLLAAVSKMGWHYITNRNRKDQVEAQAKALTERESALLKERVAIVETTVKSRDDSMKEGRVHFRELDNKTDSLEKHKLDKIEFDKYCANNEREHARIEAGIDKLANRFDALSTKFDDVSANMSETVSQFRGSVETLKRIEGKLVDSVMLGSGGK